MLIKMLLCKYNMFKLFCSHMLDVIHGGESSRAQQHTDEGAEGNY